MEYSHSLSTEFSPAQEDQIASVYAAMKNLLAVLVPDNPVAQDFSVVGSVAEFISDHLLARGFELAFPVRVTADDGEIYVMASQKTCRNCGCLLDDLTDERSEFIINPGHSDTFSVCFACHRDLMESGSYTQCEACHNYFEPDYLRDNPANGVRELCPCCGEVWCE